MSVYVHVYTSLCLYYLVNLFIIKQLPKYTAVCVMCTDYLPHKSTHRVFRSMMSACAMTSRGLTILILLLHTGQVACSSGIKCPTYFYLYDGRCYPCPKECKVCVSDSECTVCEKGFYGHACESTCTKNCTCHKTYGHCTYGCPDREYPEEGNGCEQCPEHCSVCASVSKCSECDEGYFGDICQNTCPDQCYKCNISTGKCLECSESNYLRSGTCKSCPHGCSKCIAADNCLVCEHWCYGPFDGKCICLCPDTDLRSYFLPDDDGKCGLWRDIDQNICEGQSKSRSCTSRGNCIHDVGNCTASDICVTGTEMQGQCGRIMQYACEHTCTRITSRYGCEDTCTVHSNNTSTVCLANVALTLSKTIEYQVDCKQEEGTLHDSKETTSKTVVTVVVVVSAALAALAILGILLLVIHLKRRSQKRKAGETDQHGSELQDMPNTPEGNNNTEPETRAPILTESEKETTVSLTSDQLTNLLLQPETKAHYRSCTSIQPRPKLGATGSTENKCKFMTVILLLIFTMY